VSVEHAVHEAVRAATQPRVVRVRPVVHQGQATVKSHVTHLFEKLAATNRGQLAIAAFRAGLVE
jgi:hypothetical protein